MDSTLATRKGSFWVVTGAVFIGFVFILTGLEYFFYGSGFPKSPLAVVIGIGVVLVLVGVLLARRDP